MSLFENSPNISSPRSAQGVEPCWRCIILGEQCDGQFPCGKCVRTARAGQRIGCRRGELRDRLKDKLPCIPGYGSTEFFLSATDGSSSILRVRMTYNDPSSEIRDLELSVAETTSPIQFSASLADFLRQFCNIDRWRGDYEPSTGELIKLCAEIQADILPKVSPTTLPTEDTLIIAWALRAFGLAHQFGTVAMHLPFTMRREMPRDLFAQPTTSKHRESYTIELWRYNREIPEQTTDGGQLSSIIQDFVHITQHILFRRQPKDWPYVFCALLILRLTINSLTRSVPWMDPFKEAEDDLESVYSTLLQLYEAATKGCCHPLADNWNCEAYTVLVGRGDPAIAHFKMLHGKWINEEWSEFDNDNLEKKIDLFTAGYEVRDF